jgi:hypothetical protein
VTPAAATFDYDAMAQWKMQAIDAKWHIPSGIAS